MESIARHRARHCARPMLALAGLVLALGACSGGRGGPASSGPIKESVTFLNVTPGTPERITALLVRPPGDGPFPALVQLHGCGGLEPQSYRWADWFAGHGYAALVVDSFGPRGVAGDCRSGPGEPPISARLDDAFGGLVYLQAQPFIRGDGVAAIGWSQGGVYAMAVINGPSLERAERRGVKLPAVGFAAGIGVYPGGCFSLVKELVVRPLLVLIGRSDDWTPAVECEEMVTAMKARGADVTLVEYPGAYHYFDVEGLPKQVLATVENEGKPGGHGATVAYQAAAAEDARRQIAAFLTRTIGAGAR